MIKNISHVQSYFVLTIPPFFFIFYLKKILLSFLFVQSLFPRIQQEWLESTQRLKISKYWKIFLDSWIHVLIQIATISEWLVDQGLSTESHKNQYMMFWVILFTDRSLPNLSTLSTHRSRPGMLQQFLYIKNIPWLSSFCFTVWVENCCNSRGFSA